jgi:plastocyanin
MPRNLAVLLSAGAMALAVAACGSSSSSSSSTAAGGGSSATSSAPAATSTTSSASSAASSSSSSAKAPSSGGSSHLKIAAAASGQLMFSTDHLTAKAGTVDITFTNPAPEGHNFTLMGPGGKMVAATPTFKGGSKSISVKLTAGKYTYICSVPGHAQGGMMGTLTVS